MSSFIGKIPKVLISILTFGLPLLVDVLAKKKTEQWLNGKTFVTYYEGDSELIVSFTVRNVRKSFVLRIDQLIPKHQDTKVYPLSDKSERSDLDERS